MKTHMDFPGNICLRIGNSIFAAGVPKEEDVLSAIECIENTTNKQILLESFRDGKTLKEIGHQLGLSTERVRQRRELALRSVRKVLFPPAKRENPNDRPILNDSHPLRHSQEPFEIMIKLSDSKIRTLHEYGYFTIADICRSSRNSLFNLRGFGYHSADIIIDAIRTVVGKGNTNYEE